MITLEEALKLDEGELLYNLQKNRKVEYNNILFVGAGPGGNILSWLRNDIHNRLDVLDSDKKWLEFFNDKAAEFGISLKKNELIHADISDPQLLNREGVNHTYNTIVCNNVLHFLNEEEIRQSLKNMYDLLESEGTIELLLNFNIAHEDTELGVTFKTHHDFIELFKVKNKFEIIRSGVDIIDNQENGKVNKRMYFTLKVK